MDNFSRNHMTHDGDNAGRAIAGAICQARIDAARKEYNRIVSIDYRNPGADYGYCPERFLRHVTAQAKTFAKFIETAAIAIDLMTFAQAASAIGYKHTGLSRSQCQQLLTHFAPYTQMEASRVIGACSPDELAIELNHWLAMGGF